MPGTPCGGCHLIVASSPSLSSAVQFRCAKSRARAVIGMLAHDSAPDIIKIDNDNLRKVCADLASPSSASIATLFHCLLTSTPLGSVLALAGMSCVCYICGCEHQVAASARASRPTRWMWGRRWCVRASGKGRRDRLHRIVTFRGVLSHGVIESNGCDGKNRPCKGVRFIKRASHAR